MAPLSKRPVMVPKPRETIELVVVLSMEAIDSETNQLLFFNMPDKTEEQRASMTELEGRWEVENQMHARRSSSSSVKRIEAKPLDLGPCNWPTESEENPSSENSIYFPSMFTHHTLFGV
uniref:Uncharacterized protein n=1 Tax=Bionectria ochroleuca TaxID=29856 RepID=A0A8H7K7A1_BIOOC